MDNKIKVALILLLVFIVLAVGIYFFIVSREKASPPKEPLQVYEEIPGQREKEKVGEVGDFDIKISLNREGDKIILDWAKNIKVYEVLITSLGEDYTYKDNKIVWRISSKNTDSGDVKKLLENLPSILPLYELLSIPEGFYLFSSFAQVNQPEFQFEKGARYSVELRSGGNKRGAYIFIY